MIQELNTVTIHNIQNHTVFIPQCHNNLFKECATMMLKFANNKVFINSKAVINNNSKNIYGTTFIMNLYQLLPQYNLDNHDEGEDIIIDNLLTLCQNIANFINRSIYYHIKYDQNEDRCFQIRPENR